MVVDERTWHDLRVGLAAADDDLPGSALAYAACGFEVFPLKWHRAAADGAGKAPLTRHGVLDATNDVDVIAGWWAMWRTANIGLRIPCCAIVLDIDPRNGGITSLTDLEHRHGPLPRTLTSWSGRDDGGRHLWFTSPAGTVTGTRLGDGIDLKTRTGYVVAPPSRHPATGLPYRWEW